MNLSGISVYARVEYTSRCFKVLRDWLKLTRKSTVMVVNTSKVDCNEVRINDTKITKIKRHKIINKIYSTLKLIN